MNKLQFSKMQSLGNDFIVIYEDAKTSKIFDFEKSQIKRLTDRKKGIGADQVLVVREVQNSKGRFYYKIFNADGREAEQCGNGARCVKKFLFDRGFWKGNNLTLVAMKSEFFVQSENNKDFVVGLKALGTSPEDVGFASEISEERRKGENLLGGGAAGRTAAGPARTPGSPGAAANLVR